MGTQQVLEFDTPLSTHTIYSMSDYDPSTGRRRSRRVVDRTIDMPRPILIRLMLAGIFRMAIAPHLDEMSAIRLILAFYGPYPRFVEWILRWMQRSADNALRASFNQVNNDNSFIHQRTAEDHIRAMVLMWQRIPIPHMVYRRFVFMRPVIQITHFVLHPNHFLNAIYTGDLGVSFDRGGRVVISWMRTRMVTYDGPVDPTRFPNGTVYMWMAVDDPPFPMN